MQSLFSAATGLSAQERDLAVRANNIANVNTTGFKQSRSNMQSLMYQNIREAGQEVGDARTPSGLSIGVGVQVGSTQEIHTQGGLRQTDNDLDLAISGDGFFQVTLPTGEIGYSRDGTFRLDGDGNVVTSSGYLLEPQIAVPANAQSVEISEQGVVSVRVPNESQLQQVGNIELARFINKSGLSNRGGNVYLETDASGAPIVSLPGEDGAGSVLQGKLETSNVNIASEMVGLIQTQRAYEMASKAITTSSDMYSQLNEVVR